MGRHQEHQTVAEAEVAVHQTFVAVEGAVADGEAEHLRGLIAAQILLTWPMSPMFLARLLALLVMAPQVIPTSGGTNHQASDESRAELAQLCLTQAMSRYLNCWIGLC